MRSRPVLNVQEDQVTVGQMIQFLGRRLTMEDKPVSLHRLLGNTRSQRALVAMFLALLELVRLQAILLNQDRNFSEIFIKKNAGRLHTSIVGLKDITGILVKQKSSLEETLAIAPVALANIVHAYQPDLGVIATRSNLDSLTNPVQLCQAITAIMNHRRDGAIGESTKRLVRTEHG